MPAPIELLRNLRHKKLDFIFRRKSRRSSKTPILIIPRELRDEIIDLVLLSGRIPPQRPDEKLNDRIELYECPFHNEFKAGLVKYIMDPSVYLPNGIGLLLANRQLHEETMQRIKDHEAQNLWKYKIDIMLVEEKALWPTWVCIPPKIVHADTMEVTFRIMGCDETAKRPEFQFSRGGGPSPITWGFYCILDRFLRLGPAKPITGEYVEKAIKVKNIKMNFITPECPVGFNIIPDGLPIEREEWEWRIRYSDRAIPIPDMSLLYIPSAESLAKFIHTGLWMLLAFWNTIGRLLVNGVDTISLFIDGELHEMLDLVSFRATKGIAQ